MAELILTKENFENEVIKSDVPVLVDFFAEWCVPCRLLSPTVEKLADEADGTYKVGKVNIDTQDLLAAEYRIMSIPTVKIFVNGEVKETFLGLKSESEFRKSLGC